MITKIELHAFFVTFFFLIIFNVSSVFGATVSGTITDSSGTGVENLGVTVYTSSYDGCGTDQSYSTQTNAEGVYTVNDITTGTFYIKTNSENSGLTKEFWATGGSVPDCNTAQTFQITSSGQTETGKDFQLETESTIAGRILDNQGAPIANIPVSANLVGNPCDWNTSGNGHVYSDNDGYYTITGLAVGTYYVATQNWNTGYIEERWADGSSVQDCTDADPVIINAPGQNETDKDFQLEMGATISGTVTDSNGQPIANLAVNLNDTACGWDQKGSAYTDANGDYDITGLPTGTYYIATDQWNSAYISEWWADSASVQDCSSAEPVTVNTTGQEIANKNFQLELGATISGTVTDEAGQPIANLLINLYDSACGWNQKGSTSTDANGDYDITGLPTGTYYIATDQWNSAYISEWWADEASVQDCNSAESVTINTAGQAIANKDFQLELGATILGSVTDTAGQPIANLQIHLYDTACGGSWKGSASTDSSGNYNITGLPLGTYYIVTAQWNSAYVSEWWADGASVQDCNSAEPVIINTPGQNLANKDFQLELGGTISGTVTDDTGQPIANLQVTLYDMACGGGNWKGSASTNSNGEYTLVGLLPESYYIQTNTGTAGYLIEWWAAEASVEGCNNAEPVTIDTVGQNINTKNFQLELGATISGRITDSTGAPIANLQVSANPQFIDCSSGGGMGGILPNASTNNDGDYTILGLPTGSYLLDANTYQTDYIREWWSNTGSVQDQSLATLVSITVNGQTETNKNFQLELGVSISGVLTNAGGETISSFTVYAVKGDTACSFGYSQFGMVDGEGNYTIRGLAPGSYFVKANNWWDDSVNYIDEWWSTSEEAYSCNNAEAISVTTTSITGKNIQLDVGATISGIITNSSDDPLSNITIYASTTDDPCDDNLFFSGNIIKYGHPTSTGEYTITGIAAGNYYLWAENWEHKYVQEWYTDAGGTKNCSSALPITVQAQEVLENKDFQLDQGGTISGTIFEADGTTPINGNVNIQIFSSDPCSTSEWAYESFSYLCTGQYTTPALPPGDYYLSTYSQDNDYSNEWWASPSSASSCSSAQQITVSAGVNTPDKNFQLNQKKHINLNSIFMLLLKDEN